jgi:NAD+ kinase
MHIGVFCAFLQEPSVSYALEVIDLLLQRQHEVHVDLRLKKHLKASQSEKVHFFDNNTTINPSIDFLFTVGGDGTLLRAVPFVKDTETPIFGINTGRLGFLTSLQKESLKEGLDLFFDKKYQCIERSLLKVSTSSPIAALEDFDCALNEVSISRKNTTSMLSITTTIDGKPLTTYWADGLIIATPTGSTGYSLSSGGPILTPDNNNWILNPIAPHNINFRPLIIPDTSELEISVSGRDDAHLLALDSRTLTVKNGVKIRLKKAPFTIRTVQLEGDTFFKTLRDKLFWGIDTRNVQ